MCLLSGDCQQFARIVQCSGFGPRYLGCNGGFMLRYVLRSILAAALIVDQASATEPANSPSVPTITIRVNTRLVVVDVVVTDKKGQPFNGLNAEDFTVEENGKKQKIAVFSPPGTNRTEIT